MKLAVLREKNKEWETMGIELLTIVKKMKIGMTNQPDVRVMLKSVLLLVTQVVLFRKNKLLVVYVGALLFF